MAREPFRIGELARRVGLAPRTVRFYEARGILPCPARGPNRYRLYDHDAVDLLRFVQQAQGLGLTLAEIREIVVIRRAKRPPCPHVHRLLERKAVELDRKLADLLALRQRIRRSLAVWSGRPPRRGVVCPHIEAVPSRTGAARPDRR